MLGEILRGGARMVGEAGVVVVGGHTIDDAELDVRAVGLGRRAPDRVVANAGARPGDVLVLTKPLGTGLIATALKQGRARRTGSSRAGRRVA